METTRQLYNRKASGQISRTGRKARTGRGKILVINHVLNPDFCNHKERLFPLRALRPLREVTSGLDCISLLSLGLGLLLCAGCQTSHTPNTVMPTPPAAAPERAPAPAAKPAAKPETADERPAERRRALLDTDIDFARVSEDKGTAEAYLEFLTADATLLPEGELPIQGRDAIRVHQAAGPEGVLLWKPRSVEVAGSGELGYTWGVCEFHQNNSDGRQAIRYGKYITAWKKQPDGSWKAHLLIRNSSPPPEQRR